MQCIVPTLFYFIFTHVIYLFQSVILYFSMFRLFREVMPQLLPLTK
jgi:hypothetical protein